MVRWATGVLGDRSHDKHHRTAGGLLRRTPDPCGPRAGPRPCGGCIVGLARRGALTRRLEPLLGGSCEASLVGCAQRTSIYLAALHNGTISSVHELDDVHLDAAIHPGVVVIPAALAVAEATQCGPQELLGGIVAGYEVMARVGWMLGPSHYHQWHTTSTAG